MMPSLRCRVSTFSRRHQGCAGPDCYSCNEIPDSYSIPIVIRNVLDTSVDVALLENGKIKRSWKISSQLDTINLPLAVFDTFQGGLKISLNQNSKTSNSRYYLGGTYMNQTQVSPKNSSDTLFFEIDSNGTKRLVRTNYSERYTAKNYSFCQTNIREIFKIRIDTNPAS